MLTITSIYLKVPFTLININIFFIYFTKKEGIHHSKVLAFLHKYNNVQGLLQITIDALTAGNFNGVPALVNPDTTAIAEPIILDFTTIVAAKTTIQSDSIDFADVYGPVQYDRDAYRLIIEYT